MTAAALQLVDGLLATEQSRVFGALPPPAGVSPDEVGACSPIGPVWDPSMLVPFEPPLLLDLAGRSYVLVSAHGDDVMRWVIRPFRDFRTVGTPMTFNTLHTRVGPALGRLLVLVNQPPDNRPSWHPWALCNPFNCLSRTTLTENRVCALGDAALAFETAAALQRVMSTVCEAKTLLPLQPEQGYISRADILALPGRRAAYVATEAARARAARELAEAERRKPPEPPAFEPEFIGDLPPGCDEVVLNGEDRRMAAAKCNYDVLTASFSVRTLRRFLNAYSRLVTNHDDFRLPTLVRVVAKKLARGPCEAVCCVFSDTPTTVWASEAALRAVSATLEQESRRYGRRKQRPDELVLAMNIAGDYNARIDEYVTGVDRPPSPHRLTEEEEIAAAGVSGEGSAADKVRLCEEKIEAAKKVLWDQAGSRISRADMLSLTVDQLEEKQRSIYQTMLRSNTLYRKLVNDKRVALRDRTAGRDVDFDPGDDAYCGADFRDDDDDDTL